MKNTLCILAILSFYHSVLAKEVTKYEPIIEINSVDEINDDDLKSKLIIFDLDNTVIQSEQMIGETRAIGWFIRDFYRQGFKGEQV